MSLRRLFGFALLVFPLVALAVDPASRTNVLLIVSDDLRACLSCYGDPVCRTPNIDRLARGGVLFERAYCQYPVCHPSRASFMSGLYPNTTKLFTEAKKLGSYKISNPALAKHPSIGEFLRNHDYFSGRVGKIYHMGIPGGIEAGEPGGDEPDSWDWTYNLLAPETFGVGQLELLSPIRQHMGSNFARMILPDEREGTQHDVMACQQAIAVLENKKGAKMNFFLAVGFVRPHVPLVAPKRYFDLYPPEKMKLPFVPEGDLDDVPKPAAAMDNMPRYGMNETQQRQAMAGYYACVSFMDEQVGKLLDALDRLDLRKNTVVIFTSDHGYNLGEHHCWQKLSLFEDSMRVPLIISAPGFTAGAGQKTQGIVELVDLYPTIADLLGFKNDAPGILQGKSLRSLLEQPQRAELGKECAFAVSHMQGESVRTARWRYNVWGKAGEELYDHETDPNEYTNLAKKPEHAATLEKMRALLADAKRKSLGRGAN